MAGVVGARVLFGSCASVGASSLVDAIVVSRRQRRRDLHLLMRGCSGVIHSVGGK